MYKVSTFLGESEHGYTALPLFGPADAVFEKTASASLLPEVLSYIENLKPKPGCQYVLVNAMGAGEYYGSNINGDHFEEAGLIHTPPNWSGNPLLDKELGKKWTYGYPTFYNAYPYAHHRNKDSSRAYGEVELAVWNEGMKRVELVCRVDHDKCQEFGGTSVWDKLKAGQFPDVSMGSKVCYDLSSITTDWDEYNKALATHDPSKYDYPGLAVVEYHKKLKAKDNVGIRGLSITRHDYDEWTTNHMNRILPDGRKVFVYNPYPRFFDISFVFMGADRTAKVMVFIVRHGGPRYVPSAEAGEKIASAGVQIRALSPAEHEAASALEKAHFGTAPKKHELTYGAFKNDELLGAARLNLSPLAAWKNDEAHKDLVALNPSVALSSIVVDPNHRGAGVGRALLKHVVNEHDRVLLGTGRKSDASMSHLAASEGFKPVLQRSNNTQWFRAEGSPSKKTAAPLQWIDPNEVFLPHEYDLTPGSPAALKVDALADAFGAGGYDESQPAPVGYPVEGKYQLLDGGHRALAAQRAGIQLPVLMKTRDGRIASEDAGTLEEFSHDPTPVKELRAKKAAVDDDFLKRAFGFKNAELKQGEIEKELPADKAVPLLSKTDRDIPEWAINALSSVPEDKALSTSGGMGIVLKPREFQRITLIRLGKKDLADELDSRGELFPKVDEASPCSLITGSFLPALARILQPLLESRSGLAPYAEKRVIIMQNGGDESPASLPREDLRKIGAAYNGYRQALMELVASSQDLLLSAYPADAEVQKLASAAPEELFTPLSYTYFKEVFLDGVPLVDSAAGVVKVGNQSSASVKRGSPSRNTWM